MDLVVGATGILGAEICKGLMAEGRAVRALVRSSSAPDRVAALKAAGVETVLGDLKDPTSVAAACAGVDTVISTASSTLSRAEGDDIETVDRQGQLNLVEAAERAGAGRFIFVSFPPDESSFPLQDAKRAVEAAIVASGVPYTILHPTHFREVWLSAALGFEPENAKARLFGNGDGAISWISLFDVAKAVIASVDNPKASNRVIRLGGPEAIPLAEVIARFEKATGKDFEREVVPHADLEGMLASDDPLTRSFGALMMICARQGCAIDNAEARDILGFEPSPIDDHIAQSLKG